MEPTELYRRIFAVEAPWQVTAVDLKNDPELIVVTITRTTHAALMCPLCGTLASGYDKHPHRWHHLDACQFPTYVEADVPCPEYGMRQVRVQWAEQGSGPLPNNRR